MLTTQSNKANRLVAVHCIHPFRLNEGGKMREVKGDKLDAQGNVVEETGENVEIELWLANALANHHPPKVGPVTNLGKRAQQRAAA